MQTIFIGMTGRDEFVPLLTGERVMPLNEIPKYFNPETRHLVDAALEDAWQELNKDGIVEALSTNEIGLNDRCPRIGWRDRPRQAQMVCTARCPISVPSDEG
jgi:hypothetical protein